MRVFLMGASGVVGGQLVPALVASGHEVTATTRTEGKRATLAAAGAKAVVVDALDRDAVIEAVGQARPDVVIHQATALQGAFDLKHFDEYFALTNRLRTEGTENLLAAAAQAGVPRIIAQSYVGWPNARTGSAVKSELDPLDPTPVPSSRLTHAGIRRLEELVTTAPNITGIVLRYGSFYGPGTSIDPSGEGEVSELVRRRRFPVVGGGGGVWSFTHVEDAALAAVAALTGGVGIYNVVDDDPAPVSQWLPYLAEVMGAKAPQRLPRWVARPMVGEMGISMMTSVRGSSNAKAKRELAWTPRYPSWRTGFRA